MDAGHHHVELGEQLLVLIERSVLEDVDLDAGQDAERGQLGVELGDDLELLAQALGVEPVGDGEPGAVVGECPVAVPELPRRLGHLPDGAASVRPVGVAVAVALQLVQQGGGRLAHGRGLHRLELRQVLRRATSGGLGDHLGAGLSDPGIPEPGRGHRCQLVDR